MSEQYHMIMLDIVGTSQLVNVAYTESPVFVFLHFLSTFKIVTSNVKVNFKPFGLLGYTVGQELCCY